MAPKVKVDSEVSLGSQEHESGFGSAAVSFFVPDLGSCFGSTYFFSSEEYCYVISEVHCEASDQSSDLSKKQRTLRKRAGFADHLICKESRTVCTSSS